MVSYVMLMSGLCFLFAGLSVGYRNKKNSKKFKYGHLQVILFLLAGVFMFISAFGFK